MPPLSMPPPQSARRNRTPGSQFPGSVLGWAGVFLVFLFLGYGSANAQASLEILDPVVTHSFGEWIQFEARINTTAEAEEVILFFRPDGPYETIMLARFNLEWLTDGQDHL